MHKLRKEKGITQEKLSELSNYSLGYIMNIESLKDFHLYLIKYDIKFPISLWK